MTELLETQARIFAQDYCSYRFIHYRRDTESSAGTASRTAGTVAKGTETNVATGEYLLEIVSRWGFVPGQIVQEIGWDEDVDQNLREVIQEAVDGDLEDDDFGEVADVVMLWFRDEDGDLTDALVDAVTALDEGGNLWLLTPLTGESGHVSPSVVQEAASTAGLNATSPVVVGERWSASRIAVRARGK